MSLQPEKPEIDHHTIKLIIGLIAIFLATLTSLFSQSELESISASYHEGGSARNIFVGFLFAISAFLLAYNGGSSRELVLSKIAAVAAMGVAMFPCECEGHPEYIPYVHAICAAVMFVILAIFCYEFYQRAYPKGHTQARARAYIYAFCGFIILICIAVLAIDGLSGGIISEKIRRLTFIGEATGLIAFGVAWLTASRALPLITSKEERLTLSPFVQKQKN